MELHTERIDEAVLSLLHLGLHDGAGEWKSPAMRMKLRRFTAFSLSSPHWPLAIHTAQQPQ